MRTLFVTCLYSKLFGSEFGGRDSRDGHYKNSLKSLLKMSDAQFICYTSENQINDLETFFYKQNNFSEDQIQFKIYDLKNCEFHNKISELKKTQSNLLNDRCYEIQYSKFFWCLENCDNPNYDYVFWIDAGLSHSGLIPPKYLYQTKGYWEKYFESKLFNNNFLNNLITHTDEQIVVCAKENQRNHWSKTLPKKYYNSYSFDRHIIGGLFGGKKEKLKHFCNLFGQNIRNVLNNETELYLEENIMSLIFSNNNEIFNPLLFDIWWHEEDSIPGVDLKELTLKEKSFYKIIENLNNK